jgi:hypothetical protein
LQDTVGFANAQTEVLATQQELQTQIRDTEQSRADIIIKTAKMGDVQIATMDKEIERQKNMISLTDSLGLGLGAQMKTRNELLGQLGQKLRKQEEQTMYFENAMMESRKKQANLSGEDLAKEMANERKFYNEMLDSENKVLAIQKERAEVSKTMREGWLDAIKAMASGAGVFQRIVIKEETNLGLLAAKRKDNIKTLKLGGEGEGRLESSAFTIGGFREGAAGAYEKEVLKKYGAGESADTRTNVKSILAVQNEMLKKVSTAGASFGQGPNQSIMNMGTGNNVTVITNSSGNASTPSSVSSSVTSATQGGNSLNVSANEKQLVQELSDIFKRIGSEIVTETIKQIRSGN